MLYLYDSDQLEYYDSGFGFNCSYDFPYRHIHNYWEMIFTIYPLLHEINGCKEEVPADSILIIKPTDCHYLKALTSPANPDKKPTHINIKIRQDFLHSFLDVFEPSAYSRLLVSPHLKMQINRDTASRYAKIAHTILTSKDRNIILLLLKTLTIEIFNHFNDIIYQDYYEHQQKIPDVVQEIVTKMNSPSYMMYGVKELTKDCNYSYMQLTRLFKKHTGSTMQDYFTTVKLQNAAFFLKNTDKLILDIANDIAMSLSHFDHVFKEKYGVSPRKYRARAKRIIPKELNLHDKF